MPFLKYSQNSFSDPELYDAYQFPKKIQNHCTLAHTHLFSCKYIHSRYPQSSTPLQGNETQGNDNLPFFEVIFENFVKIFKPLVQNAQAYSAQQA
jgi:hypothetical protein